MPIDGHSYLTKRGWAGKGSGLRAGSVARPIVASQKRDSRGLGKDRDDHFEFWDYVYAAAAMTIKINVSTEEEQGECDRLIGLDEEPRGPQRTSSGLVSTQRSSKLKRPGEDEAAAAAAIPPGGARGGESLVTIAKREAARRMLYSKFYRGEVLRGEYEEMAVVEGPEDGFSGERKREGKKKRKREEGGEEHHQKRKKRKQKGKEKELENGGVCT